MGVTTLGPEIVAILGAEGPSDPVPTILEDLSVSIERGYVTGTPGVPSSTAIRVGHLRRIGVGKLTSWGLSDLVDDAELLISELVTNGIRHGTGPEVVFRLVIGEEFLVLEVHDGSPQLPRVRTAGPGEENGRGMFLVDALATSWGVSADGTTTWCILTKPAQAEPNP
ncbi:ATP-binding protein [Streptomyces sp. NPDC091292]|uniref:ATP-binding protein n=1 Tax=Streptomyces sp. NPDC091292 TaxID=3365991 RepID=UPI00382DF31D